MGAVNTLKPLLNFEDLLDVDVPVLMKSYCFQNHRNIAMFAINEQLKKVDYSPKYLNLPKDLSDLNISLDGGYENSILIDNLGHNKYNDYRKVKYDHFCKWIVENNYVEKLEAKGKPTFIGFSGNIAQLLMTPFDTFEDWIIHVVRLNNLFFIDKVDTPSKGNISRNSKANYHAHKFAQLFVTDSEDSVNENLWRCFLDKSINNFEKELQIHEVDFGNHSFLILHELKAIDPNGGSTVEFKIVKSPSNAKVEETFRNQRSLQMWARAVIAGINKTVCGFRQFSGGLRSTGLLKKIEIYSIESLESMEHEWSPDVCYNFFDRLLRYIVKNVPYDNRLQTYELTRKLGEKKVTCERFNGECFVPLCLRDCFNIR